MAAGPWGRNGRGVASVSRATASGSHGIVWGEAHERSLIGMRLCSAQDQTGKVKIALLLWLVVLGTMGYFGFQFGGAYWRRYKLEEAVAQHLGYAGQLPDEAIHQNVLALVAEMELPPLARQVWFNRSERPRALNVSISYVETVNLLVTTKKLRMSVQMRRTF